MPPKLKNSVIYNVPLLRILAPTKFVEFDKIVEGNKDIAFIRRSIEKEIEKNKEERRELNTKLMILEKFDMLLLDEQGKELMRNFSTLRQHKG